MNDPFKLHSPNFHPVCTGKVCCRKEITYGPYGSHTDFKTSSLQPKLIFLALSSLYLLGIHYFYTTGKRTTKCHNIPRLRRSLITLKEQGILLAIFLGVLLMDQSFHGFIEFHYSELGPFRAFWIWWTELLLGYFVTNIAIPAFCIRYEKIDRSLA